MSFLSDAIITINKEDYQAAKKMHSKKVYHINGVGCDTSKYKNAVVDRDEYRRKLGVPSDAVMILDIGELSERKNHKIVIEALGKIGDKNIVLVICGKAISGQGTYNELLEAAQRKDVFVIFAGHRLDIPQICKCADFGVLASTREGLGMAGIEMLASGLPLVTSNVHGIKDYMTDGVTGFMCDPYNTTQFSEAISKLCDSQVRNKMRDACIKSAERFDISVSYRQMKDIYEELLK